MFTLARSQISRTVASRNPLAAKIGPAEASTRSRVSVSSWVDIATGQMDVSNGCLKRIIAESAGEGRQITHEIASEAGASEPKHLGSQPSLLAPRHSPLT